MCCLFFLFLGGVMGCGEQVTNFICITLFSLHLLFIHFILSYPIEVLAFLWTPYCIIYFCVSLQSPSDGPLISCSWFHDALLIIRKASPEGCLFQASGVIKGRKTTSCSMWRKRKILHVNSVKGYSKMTGRPPFLPIYSHEADLWKGCNFSMEDTRKGYLLSNIVYLRVRAWTSGRSLSKQSFNE